MTEHNLPEPDDAPWLDTSYDGFNFIEEYRKRPGGTMTKQLSPAAQAVMNAYTDAPIHINWATRFLAAAVLRAAADIVDDREASRQLDAIAYELEAQ